MPNEAEIAFFEELQTLEKVAVEKEEKPEAEKKPASGPKYVTPSNLVANPEAHPIILDLALIKELGVDWFSWLPDTVFHEVERTFKRSIAEVNKLKIMACMTLHVTDTFWDRWEVFEKVVQGLLGNVSRTDLVHPPTLGQLLSAVTIANTLRVENFSDEVSRYCASVFLFNDVIYAPPPLDFCQPFITSPFYHCQDCETEGSALPPFDGYCSHCSGKFSGDHPFRMKPTNPGKGKNVVLGARRDPSKVKSRFEELNVSKVDISDKLQATPEDVQVARLIAAEDVRMAWDERLESQRKQLSGWLK